MNQTTSRARPKPRYSLVTRRSRHGTSYGVYDRVLEVELITGPDQVAALAEIGRLTSLDALWDAKPPQWPKSATQVVEETEKLKQSGGSL